MINIDKKKLGILSENVLKAGEYAVEMQGKVHRSFKEDGSVLTEVDKEVSRRIIGTVRELFPEANIISEEDVTPFNPDAPYSFVLDPIDGTDVYSLGLPSFAVALGLLDSSFRPVGAYISLPRFGIACPSLFIRLDPDGEMLVNGETLNPVKDKDEPRHITASSKIHQYADISRFRGKMRIFGSTIIHLLLPVLVSEVQACFLQPCFIWDIAAAHALLIRNGMDIFYPDGSRLEYSAELLGRKPLGSCAFAGTEKAFMKLRDSIRLLG